jgi:hypothetical protein
VTAIDVAAAGLLVPQHLVDHICVSSPLASATRINCWESVDDEGQRLSDRPAWQWPLSDLTASNFDACKERFRPFGRQCHRHLGATTEP